MASPDGRGSFGLNREIAQSPHRFDFFQMVRLLEHRQRERARLEPRLQGSPVGHDDPAREPAYFRAHPSLSFPAGAISQIREDVADAGSDRAFPPAELVVTFLGLVGPSGVLPRHYTELLIERLREHDFAFRDFLDVFHHRLISLFYRAWEKYRLPLGYERSQLDRAGGEPDAVSGGLYSLVGLGTPHLRGRLEIDDEVFLHYGGHFAHFPRSAIALECLLEDYLEMPTRVLQIQGQWLRLDPADRCAMPSARHPDGRNNQLGVSVVVGQKIWEIQSKIRIRLGPLTWRRFRGLMPDGAALRPLCQLVRFYVGPDLDFDVQPILEAEEVPPCQLNASPEDGPYLGWNTWLQSAPFERPADDAVFECNGI
jgi:type VI secretion system protein ImpH